MSVLQSFNNRFEQSALHVLGFSHFGEVCSVPVCFDGKIQFYCFLEICRSVLITFDLRIMLVLVNPVADNRVCTVLYDLRTNENLLQM